MVKLSFKRLCTDAALPRYSRSGDSGMDVASVDRVVIPPRSFALIRTGLAAVIPEGHEIQVRPRSGMQCTKGIVGAWGTVDSGYRGEIKVALYNHSDVPYLVEPGARVAQFVLAPVLTAEICETDDLGPETDRGTGGFGSTGV